MRLSPPWSRGYWETTHLTNAGSTGAFITTTAELIHETLQHLFIRLVPITGTSGL